MIFFVLICLMLTVMSYFSCTKDTFRREYLVQFHVFKTKHYYLGVNSEDLECEDQNVNCITFGLLFVVFRLTTYAHTQNTLNQYPWLYDKKLLPTWQRILIQCYRFLQISKNKGFRPDKFA